MPHAPLIIDVAGLALSPVDRQRLQHPLVGGVILFARNWRDRAQLTALCHDIKAVRADLLVCADQEGGRVQRFRGDGFTRLPPMRALGALWQRDRMQALDAASACGQVMAGELRACGVDFSFAPVLDLDWGRASVVGERAFHRQPRVVAQLARSLMHGMLSVGMQHCAKHFPGHGYATADSHAAVPRDGRTLRTVLQHDAAPYAWLGSVLTAVMPSHVVYGRVDARPAGFSARWLQEVLRGQLGFDGAIISDDLSMAAARQVGGRTLSAGQAILAALAAGCDLALLCNQSLDGSPLIDQVLAELEQAAASGHWQPGPRSAQRRLALLPTGAAPAWDALQASRRYQRARQRVLELCPPDPHPKKD